MPPAPLPLDGPFHHEETPRKDIASVKVKMAKAKYLATELNQSGRTGSDDATEAGYNSESRTEVLMLTKECQAVVDFARSLQVEISETIEAIKEIETIKDTQHPSADSPGLRREASAQILELLTGSRKNLITLVRQVLSGASPEMGNVSRMTDSQTVRWIDGAQQMPQVDALQQTIQQKDEELSALKEEVERKKTVAFEFERDRHQALTNLEAERAKVASSEKQTKRTQEQLDSAQERIIALEEELRITKLSREGYQKQVQHLDEASRDLEDEKDTLAYQLFQRDQSIVTLRQEIVLLKQRLADDAENAQVEQAVIKNKLEKARARDEQLSAAQKDLASSRQEAKGARSSLEGTISNQRESLESRDNEIRRLSGLFTARNEQLVSVQRDLASSRQEVEGTRSSLKGTILNQNESLKSKTDEIERLNVLLTARDETVDSQVEQASIFLRRMSLNVESGIWRNVVEGVLADSTVAPAAQIPWKPWRVLPSWSHDETLHIREDDRSIHLVAVDIIAIMRIPSAPSEPLLSRLQSLQEMLMDGSPLVSKISQQLLESLAGAVGDERLHLMHHVLICQIVDLLNGSAVEPTEVPLDPRATTLVSALKAWDPESGAGLDLNSSVSYPDFALVGFNRNPAGIIAASPSNRELRWVDEARINIMLTHIELSPEKGDSTPIQLPLDTIERQTWSVAHL
ncbi:hypothetical protein H9Q69_003705 [Fusarium xylarioides]|nr:hypothetical protein H9Q69_003705 [Fusarium xylarioides]